MRPGFCLSNKAAMRCGIGTLFCIDNSGVMWHTIKRWIDREITIWAGEVMKKRMIYCLHFLWASLVAFSFPFCFARIFLDITGHAKGYSYNLGSEKELSILFGCIELLIWLIAAVPSNVYVFHKTAQKGKRYLIIPILLYMVLAVICIVLMGGLSAYMKEVFHI